ncbi:MAG: RNA-binding transcriptional accessory protein, partial [Phototrophicales bacterium]
MMNLSDKIAQLLAIKPNQVQATLDLLDADNTIPFIARYRKEMTGSLDEDQIAKIADQADKLRTLEKRRETILASIAEQGHLTPELQAQIENADSLTALEDLYLPYKPKRRTRASIARENGLQPLADMILGQLRTKDTLDALATPFLSDNVPSVADAWAGARDIVAETISDNAQVRGDVREKALRYGIITSEKIPDATDEKAVFKIYYQFTARVSSIRAYQILALNRGEAEKILRVSVQLEDRDWLRPIDNIYRIDHRSPLADQLQLAQVDAGKRLLLPAIERDIRRTLTEIADSHAIHVFAQNLRALLSQPPIPDRVVMGIDPGFRTGTKIAVVDSTGKVLATATIYPHEPQRQWQQSLLMLSDLIKKYGVSLIAIGNGTASRETEALVAELTRGRSDVHYVIVSEAGASVYSASPLARAELPDLDVTLRGAVSIARRIQDPLAELVKIDPKSIGVGLYQHDVDQKQLTATLEAVVERVVNAVGVDVNTASPALLRYVAGIGNKLAENIVAYR